MRNGIETSYTYDPSDEIIEEEEEKEVGISATTTIALAQGRSLTAARKVWIAPCSRATSNTIKAVTPEDDR